VITGELVNVLVPVWLPILVSPLVYLLRRTGLFVSFLSALTMGGVAWWLYTRPLVEDLNILGRALFLSGLEQGLLIILALWLVAAFLMVWRIPQGWSFYPFVLMAYGCIAAALMFEEMILQVLILLIAWMVVILLVQGGAQANTRAGTRLMVLAVLALPAFLIGGALMEQRIYYPDDIFRNALIVLSLGMGFVLMLGIIPFHAWLPQAAEDGPPLVAAWLVAAMGGSYLLVLIDLLARNPWLSQEPQVQRLLFTGGLVLAIGGGILTVTERHLGRLWAYAVLADLGYILLGLSLDSAVGTQAALLIVTNRFICLLLAGGALATIRHHATSLEFEQLVGLASRLPISVLAFAFGSLGMFGVPLTGGFPGHWSVLRQLFEITPVWAGMLVLSAMIGSMGFVRALAIMVSRPDDETAFQKITNEPPFVALVLGGVAMLSLIVAIAPQVFAPVIAYLMASFTL
jgi:formate hydrogenlyase subunit 3/multisubunit Na+/H+ antiporter MnhD subunit